MSTYFKKLKSSHIKPQRLFLIDGLGALWTTFMLVAILGSFPEFFGVPDKLIRILAIGAIILAVYSLSVSFFYKGNYYKPLLQIIAAGNTAYCLITVVMIMVKIDLVRLPGILYFSIEIGIVLLLVYIEIKASLLPRSN